MTGWLAAAAATMADGFVAAAASLPLFATRRHHAPRHTPCADTALLWYYESKISRHARCLRYLPSRDTTPLLRALFVAASLYAYIAASNIFATGDFSAFFFTYFFTSSLIRRHFAFATSRYILPTYLPHLFFSIYACARRRRAVRAGAKASVTDAAYAPPPPAAARRRFTSAIYLPLLLIFSPLRRYITPLLRRARAQCACVRVRARAGTPDHRAAARSARSYGSAVVRARVCPSPSFFHRQPG